MPCPLVAWLQVLEAWKKVENSVVSLVAVGLAVDEEASAEASAACTAAGELWFVMLCHQGVLRGGGTTSRWAGQGFEMRHAFAVRRDR